MVRKPVRQKRSTIETQIHLDGMKQAWSFIVKYESLSSKCMSSKGGPDILRTGAPDKPENVNSLDREITAQFEMVAFSQGWFAHWLNHLADRCNFQELRMPRSNQILT